METNILINMTYVLSAFLFIIGLKFLGHPSSARKGNFISALGMLLAICITLLEQAIISYEWIIVSILLGSAVGGILAKKIEFTSMPELVSALNGIGGISSLVVALAMILSSNISPMLLALLLSAMLIGGVTFSGSFVAWAKLSGKASFIIPRQSSVFKGQKLINILVIVAIIACMSVLLTNSINLNVVYVFIALCLVLGVLLVIPIGGADMPVVISLLNSYSGIAACGAGLALDNNLLIVAGALVGASGIILTNIMCKAMNRSLANVLFSGFTATSAGGGALKIEGEAKSMSSEDAYYVFEAAQSVLVIPGYGMAVAQAQHAMKELQNLLEDNGAEVAYGIHPVAGRMPGHMNVLLAEADVPYEQLLEMDEVNQRMEQYDIALVIGANDVVNPAAREQQGSPIYGMPVINADLAKNVFVLKRGMASGFAGIDNPLFFKANSRMIFGDAKETLNSIIRQFAD